MLMGMLQSASIVRTHWCLKSCSGRYAANAPVEASRWAPRRPTRSPRRLPETPRRTPFLWPTPGDSNLEPRDYVYPRPIEDVRVSRRSLSAFTVLLPGGGIARTYPERPVERCRHVLPESRSGTSGCLSEPTEPGRTVEVGGAGGWGERDEIASLLRRTENLTAW